jgi:hypothetical protein
MNQPPAPKAKPPLVLKRVAGGWREGLRVEPFAGALHNDVDTRGFRRPRALQIVYSAKISLEHQLLTRAGCVLSEHQTPQRRHCPHRRRSLPEYTLFDRESHRELTLTCAAKSWMEFSGVPLERRRPGEESILRRP